MAILIKKIIGDVGIEFADDHVATLEIRRGPHNFFDITLIRDLVTACVELANDGCRVVVLCSEGRNFCAGANFDTGGPGKFKDLYEQGVALFEQPLPIVAAVQGAAVGGGMGLALAADLRVATVESRFSANFARLGFHQGFGLSETLPNAIGHHAALDLLYTGRRINGEQALALGLCDRLVPADELRSAARALAGEIAASAPLAIRSIRQTLRGQLVERVKAVVVREYSEQERLAGTADWAEGVAAMSERRVPRFTGS